MWKLINDEFIDPKMSKHRVSCELCFPLTAMTIKSSEKNNNRLHTANIFQLKQTLVTFLFNFPLLPLSLIWLTQFEKSLRVVEDFFCVLLCWLHENVRCGENTKANDCQRELLGNFHCYLLSYFCAVFFFSIFLPLSTRRFGTASLPILVACIVCLVRERHMLLYVVANGGILKSSENSHSMSIHEQIYDIYILCLVSSRFCKN